MRDRREFTDPERAAIYVRDRATCCFSGANLWLLDAPLRPGFERDWVDHVKPAARGGKTEVENGVCASHTFNAKKRHNTADHMYLFEHGLPTLHYFSLFGPLTPEQTSRLQRLARLVEADWYFNRAIGLALLGFDWRCRREVYKEAPARDDRYWFRAAYRKLSAGQRLAPTRSLEEREIMRNPNEVQHAWLCLWELSTERGVFDCLEPLYAAYRANFRPWAKYFYDAETPQARRAALGFAEASFGVSPETLACIHADFALRHLSS